MKKSSVSLLALMIGLGSSMNLHADALDKWRKLNIGNNSSSNNSTKTETKQQIVPSATASQKVQSSAQDAAIKAHIAKLEAEIAKLRALIAQGGKGALTVDPEAEKKVAQEVSAYTQQLTKDIEKAEAKIDINNFRTLLEKIEGIGSAKILLELESKIMELTMNSPNAQKLEGINILLEKSDVLKEMHQKQQKAHYDNLADLGQQRLTTLIAQLKSDPTYFKKSPLTILVFMTKSTLDFSIVQKSLSKLASIFKKTSQEDIQAIYSHFHKIGIDPMKTSNSSALMQTISKMINPEDKGSRSLSESDFKKLIETDRQSFVDLINNISDAQLKEEFKKLITVGTVQAVNTVKAALALDPSPQALTYFNTLKGLTFLDEQAAIAGANKIVEKLKTQPKPSTQAQASAAIEGIKEFLTSEKKPLLTSQNEGEIRTAITSIKANQLAQTNPKAGPGAPPPPPPMNGPGNATVNNVVNGGNAKVHAIGAEIPMSKTFKDEILATIKGREGQIQAEIDKNKNKSGEVKTKLEQQENITNFGLNQETILAAAYAASSVPTGTNNKTIRGRIAKLITLDLPAKAIKLEGVLKEIYP